MSPNDDPLERSPSTKLCLWTGVPMSKRSPPAPPLRRESTEASSESEPTVLAAAREWGEADACGTAQFLHCRLRNSVTCPRRSDAVSLDIERSRPARPKTLPEAGPLVSKIAF